MLLGALGLAPAARAQDSADVLPPAVARVAGRVVTPAGERVNPVGGVMVTLHRVGPDGAGPLDSVRAGPDGRYALSYTRRGSPQAVYFAAVVYRGIAYFSAPLVALDTRAAEGTAEIVVFDTTTHALPYTIHGHHIVVGAPSPDGMRRIVEVYELSNDTTVTVVGRDSASPVWSAPLPAGATAFTGGQGDVSPAALVARAGRAEMLAPFGPGIKQLSYSYSLASNAFPLTLTLQRYTAVLEVLLEEPGAQARAPSLRAQDSASTGGRTFKRFLSQGSPQGEAVRITVPLVAASTRTAVLVGIAVLMVLAMAASLASALARRRRGVAPVQVPVSDPADALAAQIVALDTRRDAGDPALTAEAYAAERAALKARLAEALAREAASA